MVKALILLLLAGVGPAVAFAPAVRPVRQHVALAAENRREAMAGAARFFGVVAATAMLTFHPMQVTAASTSNLPLNSTYNFDCT
jgi:hypothetical protein